MKNSSLKNAIQCIVKQLGCGAVFGRYALTLLSAFTICLFTSLAAASPNEMCLLVGVFVCVCVCVYVGY